VLRTPEPVLMVLADISGYTSYLAGTELDHAENVLQDLLETVVAALSPPFILVEVEGDACFLYAKGRTVSGQSLLDSVDATYFAFRRRLRDVRQATTCQCNACVLIPRLDLKFVVHAGTAVRTSSFGRENLVGPEVIVAHRLLKNTVKETLGFSAYALFTEPTARELGLDCGLIGMPAHREEYDVGAAVGFVENLEERWQIEDTQVSRRIAEGEAQMRLDADLPAPPAIVWEWLASPILRTRWQVGTLDVTTTALRLEPGVTNHCIHGKDTTLEQIIDWRPYEESTRVSKAAFGEMTASYLLQPIDAGTRLTVLVGRIQLAPELPADQAIGMIDSLWHVSLDKLNEELAGAAVPTNDAAVASAEPAAEGLSATAS
jgi:uncharacterized protein YndB with AHSA1/START domain